jgi:hypothetical protein
MKKYVMQVRFASAMILLAGGLLAQAQAPPPPSPPPPPPPGSVDILTRAPGGFIGPNARMIAAEPAMLGQPVKGAPYSAEAVSETVRTLGDGTRIQNSQTTKIYRDGEGRIRQERTIPMAGPGQPETPRLQITISDPANRTFTVLDPEAKTARVVKLPAIPPIPPRRVASPESAQPQVEVLEGPPPGRTFFYAQSDDESAGPDGKQRTVVIERRIERSASSSGSGAGAPTAPPPPAPPVPPTVGALQTMQMTWIRNPELVGTEGLGERSIEGITAVGGRRTATIPEGAIGNDRAITSVDEEWTSPELQVTLLRTTRDPQAGEITYKLTNIQRGEPLQSLFEIPPDYKLIEGGPGAMRFEMHTMP